MSWQEKGVLNVVKSSAVPEGEIHPLDIYSPITIMDKNIRTVFEQSFCYELNSLHKQFKAVSAYEKFRTWGEVDKKRKAGSIFARAFNEEVAEHRLRGDWICEISAGMPILLRFEGGGEKDNKNPSC